MNRVGFLGGGQMARALGGGVVRAGVLENEALVFCDPSEPARAALAAEFPGATLLEDAAECFGSCDQVVLAVKPHILKAEASTWRAMVRPDQLLVSIAAGIALEDLQTWLGTKRIIRVMPNTPAMVGAGASAIAADGACDEQDLQWTESVFGAIGRTVRVEDQLIHAFTGIAGSSPAYVYVIIEALADGGVAAGLPRNVALEMSAQAVFGAAKMVLESQQHPGVLKDQVTSPGGTTIAALQSMESDAVRGAMIKAVEKCVARSKELG